MARRLTTNQKIAGSIPASVNTFLLFFFSFLVCSLHFYEHNQLNSFLFNSWIEKVSL